MGERLINPEQQQIMITMINHGRSWKYWNVESTRDDATVTYVNMLFKVRASFTSGTGTGRMLCDMF